MIGNGVVVDPHHFVAEVEKLAAQGVKVTPEILRIADNAPLILSLHRELDAMRENAQLGAQDRHHHAAASGRPTRTRSAAAPSASCDLAEPETLMPKIERLLAHHNALRRGMGLAELSR